MNMLLEYTYGVLFYLNICVGKRYDHYKLFRGIPITEDHLDFFKNISNRYDVNYWKSPGLVYMPIDFTINPKDVDAFIQEAVLKGVYLKNILKDVQKAFDNQTVRPYIRRKMDSFNWHSYYRLKDIYGWLQDLQKQYPDEVSVFTIGKTIMKRRILGVRLALKESKMRSKVIVEGGIHAREWISHAFVTYLINELVHARTSNNTELKEIALTYDWYFIPVFNPDGYVFTHTKDRMWRKNRRGGYGIDLNRNFKTAFGSVGSSKRTKSPIYCGQFPFSEPESAAVAKFIQNLSGDLEYYISFHSYGQFFIIPYAHTMEHIDNFDDMKEIGENASVKISRRHGTRYTVGTAYETVGRLAAGTSASWVKETFRVPYVTTLELSDKGDYGFALPPEHILPTCQETMDGLIEVFTPKTDYIFKIPVSLPNFGNCQCKRVLVTTIIVFNTIIILVFK